MASIYEVIELVGAGGMGHVHRVRHRGWRQDLAVKSPLPGVWEGPGGIESFLDEVNLWIDLPPHPHICPCYYVRVLDGVPRVFAEYAEGGSLAAAIRTGRFGTLEEILDVAIQMAWGLQVAHDAGVVHLDVKPANVVLTGDGRAMLTDFGLARAQARAGPLDPAVPQADSPLVSCRGMTLAYASPEQLDGQQVGRGSDLWSWAVSVLHLFVGRVSWMAGPVAPLVLETYPDQGPGRDRPAIPHAVSDLLRACLEDDPDRRPRSMSAVAERLIAIYERELGPAYPRPAAGSGAHLADGLNNKALSMLDLGRPASAEEYWGQALELDRRHPDATYNRGVLRWRNGELTDRDLIDELGAVVQATGAGDGHAEHLLSQVHLERGDLPAALDGLRRAARLSPTDPAIRASLDRVAALPEGPRRPSSLALTGHDARMTAVAVAADAEVALSADESGRILGWNVFRGIGHGRLDAGSPTRPNSPFDVVTITADAGSALTGGGDGVVRRWDLDDGRITALPGHTNWVTAVALTPDGRLAVSGGLDRSVRLWGLDPDTGRCVHVLTDHQGAVSSVAVSADGRLVLSGSWDRTARLWDVSTGRCVRILDGHADQITAVALAPDGRRAVSLDHAAMRFWDLATQQCRVVVDDRSAGFTTVTITTDGRHVLSGAKDGVTQWWEFATGRCLRTEAHHRDRILSLAMVDDDGVAVSASRDGTLQMRPIVAGRDGTWSYSRPRDRVDEDTRAAEFLARVQTARSLLDRDDPAGAADALRHARAILGYARHPDAMALWRRVVARGRRTVLVDVQEARAPAAGHDAPLIAVAVWAGGAIGTSVAADGSVETWDVPTGRTLLSLPVGASCAASASTETAALLTGGDGGEVRLWDLAAGTCTATLPGHTDRILTVAMTPDARHAVSSGLDGSMRWWDLRTGGGGGVLDSGRSAVVALAIAPDGQHVLSADRDGAVRWWNLADGRCLHTLPGDAGRSPSVATSADGRVAAVGCDDGTIGVWDLHDGTRLASLHGHTRHVLAVALSADGRHLVSAGADRTLRSWDVAAPRCLRVVPCSAWTSELALTPDAQTCVSGGPDGRQVWHLEWDVDLSGQGGAAGANPGDGPRRP